ncbi:MAG: hypothetical protein ER33_14880 [Cyanobium sp. CACIAM 14]|nr:MAG: hypothetical protein ER33_14880 [Cyanobium sp. CACIAM 14]
MLTHSTAALADPNPWGTGGGSPGYGYGQQGSGPLSFPAQGVICDSSVAVCFNASGAAIADTEREFGRRARVQLERNLLNNPVIDVTFADGRYCNFSLRGCWTTRQRTMVDQQLNPWLFGAAPGSPGGQGTVIGGAGSSWGPGSGMNPSLPPGTPYQPPFTRTRQSGTCTWTNAGISIYNGNCRYEILQNNVDGSSSLTFTFDRLPMANPLRTIRFTAAGNGPWSIRMPNGSTAAVQSRITPDPYRTRIMLAWGNVFDLRFRSSEQATTARLNQTMQPVDAYGQPVQGSESEALGEALGGLLKRLFGGN